MVVFNASGIKSSTKNTFELIGQQHGFNRRQSLVISQEIYICDHRQFELYINVFIPMPPRDWNFLDSSIFPEF